MRKVLPFPANEAALAIRVEEVSASTDDFARMAHPVEEPIPNAAIFLASLTNSILHTAVFLRRYRLWGRNMGLIR